jgi:hypothetical protein
VKPVLQALLLAEHVYNDQGTGKKVIAGTFNRLFIQPPLAVDPEKQAEGIVEVPIAAVLRPGNPFAYINLTEIHGEIDINLRLVNIATNEVCFESSSISIKCNDPLSSVELVIPVLDLPRQRGDYAFELLWNNEIIGSHRIKVEQIIREE